MSSAKKILEQLRREPTNVRFADLREVCEAFFGEPHQNGTSHLIFKMPWQGDPRVNIQDAGGGLPTAATGLPCCTIYPPQHATPATPGVVAATSVIPATTSGLPLQTRGSASPFVLRGYIQVRLRCGLLLCP